MTNLIQQKTTPATDAQAVGMPHQPSSQEASVKGLVRLLRTTEAATYVGLSPRTMEKHRTYGTGPYIESSAIVWSMQSRILAENQRAMRPRPIT
jgi:hypothetical protein